MSSQLQISQCLKISVFIFVLVSVSISVVESITSPSDVRALQAFKASIKSSSIPSYSCLGSWNFTNDPCAVPRTYFTCGILCDGNRITQLSLDSPGYIGRLTPLISQLTELVKIDLGNNKFYGPIPPLNSLTKLEILILKFNYFSGSIPPSLTLLKELEIVDLSHNVLTGALPESISSMNSLTRLDLSYNKLTGSLPKKLPSNLIELAAKANSLSGSLTKSTFDGLAQLEVVELSENWLAGAIEPWFFLMPALQQVDLSNNSFTRIEIWKPTDMNSDLIAVDLGFNSIEGYLPANFAAYPLLSSLSLRYNRFRGRIPLEYSKKESLKRLYLDGNFLNGSPPDGFFNGGASVSSGSLGDNCLQKCPVSSQLCLKSQKPSSICQHAYGGKPRS
ncbi:OLC1v1003299C1 [Oldenlandia corymbosa var. corymbosa]|uniref:OLC1v1003299C1 n=1 Tax=Oldenlandia corymbosa var. corymbosa TaxID=529605 RepID=A0AAV1DC38_OLDCO|nr:OLC1v1003299C1 [Oldenlandia corymbosa var. corymbosa]